eukprot:4052507-Amphidinium_carterae.1
MMPKPPTSEPRIQIFNDTTVGWSVDSPIVKHLLQNADRIDRHAQAEEMVVSAQLYGSNTSRGLRSVLSGEWSLATLSKVSRGEQLA